MKHIYFNNLKPAVARPLQKRSASVAQDGLTFSQPVVSIATLTGRFRGFFCLLSILLTASLCCACSKSESEITTRVTLSPDTLDVNGTTIVIDSTMNGEIHIRY